jgi:Phage tail tube protein
MQSLTTGVAIASQTTKGVAATTGFQRGRYTLSRSVPQFDYAEYLNEHSGVHQRASTRQSPSERIAVRIPVRLQGALYPNSAGAILRGLGYAATTTDQTTHKRHAFTKATVDAAVYASMLHAIGEGSGRFERKMRDIRFTNFQLEADRRTLQLSVDGMGIEDAISTGTETTTTEVSAKIMPTQGVLTWGTQALGTPRGHTFTISRPVDEEDQKLHTFGLDGLPEMGWEVTGTLRGLDLDLNFYKKLVWGGTSGIGPSAINVIDSLTFSYASPGNIPTASSPYLFQVAMTKVELILTNFEAAGNNVIRADVDYRMIDDLAAQPMTITVDNTIASYA